MSAPFLDPPYKTPYYTYCAKGQYYYTKNQHYGVKKFLSPRYLIAEASLLISQHCAKNYK